MSVSIQQGPNSSTLSAELAACEKRLADLHTFIRERMDASIESDRKLHGALDECSLKLAEVRTEHARSTARIVDLQALVSLLKSKQSDDQLQHDQEIKRLNAEHESKIQSLDAEHNHALERLVAAGSQRIDALLAERSADESEKAAAVAELESVKSILEKRKSQGLLEHFVEWRGRKEK